MDGRGFLVNVTKEIYVRVMIQQNELVQKLLHREYKVGFKQAASLFDGSSC